MSGGGNIRPESKRRRKACLELYETLRAGLELAEDALCSLVPALVANQRDDDFSLMWTVAWAAKVPHSGNRTFQAQCQLPCIKRAGKNRDSPA